MIIKKDKTAMITLIIITIPKINVKSTGKQEDFLGKKTNPLS